MRLCAAREFGRVRWTAAEVLLLRRPGHVERGRVEPTAGDHIAHRIGYARLAFEAMAAGTAEAALDYPPLVLGDVAEAHRRLAIREAALHDAQGALV